MNNYLARSPKPEKGIPGQPYREHVSEVLKMAAGYADKAAVYSSYGPLLRDVAEFAGAYHDLGKLAEANQVVLRMGGKSGLPVKHWDAGVAHLLGHPKRLINSISAFLIACHHRGLLSLPDEQLKGPLMFREPSARNDTEAWLSRYLGIHEMELGSFKTGDKDWKGKAATPLFMRMALSCLVDADHTDSARHCGNVVPEGEYHLNPGRRLSSLDHYVAALSSEDENRLERNALRRLVYDVCRNAQPAVDGLIACDSPVGTGKTTAVMAHLLNVAQQRGLRRIFVVLPFTNIIDQSVEVYRKALILAGEEPEKVIAAHHHKAEFEEETNRAFSFLWNGPVTVTTAVQFFETLASNHPATLRKLHQVAGSAIFIDEAHAAVPAHLWPQALKWIRELVLDWGCYIVMASGSLTRFWELEEFSNPQLILPELVKKDVREKAITAEKKRICYRIKDEPLSLNELCDWLIGLPGPRLIILNTVQSAASVAKELADQHGRGNVEHLSTALAPIHRKATIERVKKRLKNGGDNNWTLVATSCVEAGVDFSFRSAARELCSLVSTIQTAGRANRSGEFGTSDLWGFRIKAGALLKAHPAFKTSAQVLIDLYREQMIAPEFCREAMRREVRNLNQGLCENDPIVRAEKSRKFPIVQELFKVISSNTITVVVDEDLRAKIESREMRKSVTISELQQKTVTIYSTKAMQYGVIPIDGYGELYAWTLAYDDFLGYMAGVLTILNFTDNCCV